MNFLVSSMLQLRGAPVLALCALVLLSACVTPSGGSIAGGGLRLDGSKTVQVAVLLPLTAVDERVQELALSAEQAARMAMADLKGRVEMQMQIYDTAGLETQAAEMARLAVQDGAQVIVGPLYAGAANAVGLAVVGSGVSVLSLSNNVEIAGGNVYVLGHTFQNTAEHLVAYGWEQGKSRALLVHANTVPGQAGRDALERALEAQGSFLAGVEGYEFTQQDLVEAMSRVAERNEVVDADIVFLTADYDGGLPLIAQLLPEAGWIRSWCNMQVWHSGTLCPPPFICLRFKVGGSPCQARCAANNSAHAFKPSMAARRTHWRPSLMMAWRRSAPQWPRAVEMR